MATGRVTTATARATTATTTDFRSRLHNPTADGAAPIGLRSPAEPDPDGWSENYRGWSDTCARRLGDVPKTQSQNGALTPKPRVSS